VADFYCFERKLVIEVDGGIHSNRSQAAYDEFRTAELNQYGISVLRFTNKEVQQDLFIVLETILNWLESH
jgi:very-short-patch-repair endonuclease